jgi:hypothetical protein
MCDGKGLIVGDDGREGAEMIGNSKGGSMDYPEEHSLHEERKVGFIGRILSKYI